MQRLQFWHEFFLLSLAYDANSSIPVGKGFCRKRYPLYARKTIEYLLKQKVCICGTHLDEGSVPYAKVKELIDYLPPQSISTTIGDFKKEAKRRTNSIGNLYALIRDNTSVISQQDDEITELNDELHDIEGKLSGGDVRERVRAISGEIRICDDTIRRSSDERDRKNRERGGYETKATRADSERRNLTLLDDKNKRIEIYKRMRKGSTLNSKPFTAKARQTYGQGWNPQSMRYSSKSMRVDCR